MVGQPKCRVLNGSIPVYEQVCPNSSQKTTSSNRWLVNILKSAILTLLDAARRCPTLIVNLQDITILILPCVRAPVRTEVIFNLVLFNFPGH
jgi:hypothetical protein